jgi:tetratricopeptide (TPR) repeat protein
VGLLALAACATATQSVVISPLVALEPSSEVTPEMILALNAICTADAGVGRKSTPDLKLAAGMGTGGFKVDSKSKAAQDWFDYGLALSHAFYHEDAILAMEQAVKADPECSLCAWGQAWVLGPTLNYGIDDKGREKALVAAMKAQSLAKAGDTKAKRLADAIVARYAPAAASKGPLNYLGGARAGESKTEPVFGAEMAKIAADYPDEVELSVLAAHTLLIPVGGDDKRGLKPALAILEKVLKDHPDDTGAIHYYIHGTEFDGRAEDAIPYANELGRLAPAGSHLVHMPAHTFFHVGRYHDAAVVNAQAIAADAEWLEKGGDPAPPRTPGSGKAMYYAHNLAFGLAGALMSGDAQLALKYADHAEKYYAAPTFTDGQRAYPVPRTWVALARYAPDRALALPEKTGDPRYLLYRAYARGEAFLLKGDAAGARGELAALRKIKDNSPELQLAGAVLEGRLAMAEGNPRKAAAIFESAAGMQDAKLSDYWDPPSWWYPVRRSAAAAWLKAGDFKRAEAQAEKSLKVWKHDPLALWVLGKAQLGLGHLGQGEGTLVEARDLWRGDFDTISEGAI